MTSAIRSLLLVLSIIGCATGPRPFVGHYSANPELSEIHSVGGSVPTADFKYYSLDLKEDSSFLLQPFELRGTWKVADNGIRLFPSVSLIGIENIATGSPKTHDPPSPLQMSVDKSRRLVFQSAHRARVGNFRLVFERQ